LGTPIPALTFSHFGFFVRDIDTMVEFYTRVLGFAISDRGELDTPRGKVSLVFLTRDPREHHQIVLASGRPQELPFNAINQISFRMHDFAGLRQLYRALQSERGVDEIAPVSHGNALSVYFRDPEGNRIELFVDTPWYVDQPMRIPMDMSLADDALWDWAEKTARALPGYKPVEQWRAELANRIGNPSSRSTT
jgi:catechol 2,3-dioxygenase-like lactoylglutathione lyase family enzyme